MKKPDLSIVIFALLFISAPVFPKVEGSAAANYGKNQSATGRICLNLINNFTREIGKIEMALRNADKTSIQYRLTSKKLALMRHALRQLSGLCGKGIVPDLTKTLHNLHMQIGTVPSGSAKSGLSEHNPGRKTVIDLKDSVPLIKPVKTQGLPSPDTAAGYPQPSEPAGDAEGNSSPGTAAEYPQPSEPAGDAEGNSSSISEQGAALIARFEGSVRNSQGMHIIYNDQGGLPTIGYGHLITNPVEKSAYMNGITELQALALFKDDISRFENAVRNSLTVRVNQAQFDALVSLAYNIGIGAFSNSELVSLINAGADISEIELEWKSWNKVTIGGVKQVSQGLKNRRELEWRLYSTGQY